MLTRYFDVSFTLERLRSSPTGSYLDGFAHALDEAGYARETARQYLRAAAHLGRWVASCGTDLEEVNAQSLVAFRQHLPTCHCPQAHRGRYVDTLTGARRFLAYLREAGAVPSADDTDGRCQSPLVATFLHWMQQHRGATASTLSNYGRVATDLLRTLGDDPQQFTAASLQAFVFDHAKRYKRSTTNNLVTALRMFLRYLTAEGLCAVDLSAAIPTLAHWCLSSLPRFLPVADVERIVAACNPRTSLGVRDRAIVLLLARLGLRAGDITALRLTDVDWHAASLLVAGKGRYEARLPLSQEVGDALLAYLEVRPVRGDTDRLFLRACAPHQRPLTSRAVSSIVARAIQRAGVIAPSHGAHILRHSAATAMLEQGASLEDIRLILRHRSIDTTMHYAKVDLSLLRQIAQPWPEDNLCYPTP
jgi:integrase/recombinase XerD